MVFQPGIHCCCIWSVLHPKVLESRVRNLKEFSSSFQHTICCPKDRERGSQLDGSAGCLDVLASAVLGTEAFE